MYITYTQFVKYVYLPYINLEKTDHTEAPPQKKSQKKKTLAMSAILRAEDAFHIHRPLNQRLVRPKPDKVG